MIVLENVSKQYGQGELAVTALDNISLEISDGEFVAIMGPSGCGKSTLLNLMGCIDNPTCGKIFIDDCDVTEQGERQRSEIRKNHISFIFQNFALMDEYTIYENVEMPLLARSVTSRIRRKRVLSCLKALGISQYAEKLPSKLSGGQQQRAAIARAIVVRTPIILADEPTGALDRNNGFAVMRLLNRINEKGKTIVMVTHDREMAAYADRIINLRDGKIVD